MKNSITHITVNSSHFDDVGRIKSLVPTIDVIFYFDGSQQQYSASEFLVKTKTGKLLRQIENLIQQSYNL